MGNYGGGGGGRGKVVEVRMGAGGGSGGDREKIDGREEGSLRRETLVSTISQRPLSEWSLGDRDIMVEMSPA